jgi:hypothetical protein
LLLLNSVVTLLDIVVHRRRSYQRAEHQFARSLSHLSNSRF